ncbi:SH2 domain-containing protein [Naegleria gruberi]|uniref:SH2 domain-containing protein n=1 Tax=Naegleria gruberi TaxID=5762 RepID=D2VI37_NAEGR|nr:SH2 domain-containing protein [Naegleria gruberi]EFC43447.1 SH2 domain-containing protein [Naegleria gruberi]|eukprot:XP_002676191.1 SH2 domain-containing protein [Naegleria gruberi strain NEG-M]
MGNEQSAPTSSVPAGTELATMPIRRNTTNYASTAGSSSITASSTNNNLLNNSTTSNNHDPNNNSNNQNNGNFLSLLTTSQTLIYGYANNASHQVDPFRSNVKQLADLIRPNALQLAPQEGFFHISVMLDEICKTHEDILNNYRKYLPLVEFALSGKTENNVLFGSGGGGSIFGATSSSASSSKEAFEKLLFSLKNHINNTRNAIEGLVAASESYERRSLKASNQSSHSQTASMVNLLPTSGITSFDWSTIANKKKYFQIKDEIEILLTYHLEELRGYKEIVEKANAKGDTEVNVATIISDEFAAEFWKTNCGANVFSIDKEAFIDLLDANFQGWSKRVKKTWVEEISELIDPTCDSVVSIVDFKTVLQWFGPFTISFFTPMDSFLAQKHFWGSISSMEAQHLLDSQEPGTFLIRFSEIEAGAFSISVVEQESDDNLGLSGGESTIFKQTSHFILRRKKEDQKFLFILCENDTEFKCETVDQLIKQYRLTFKYPFTDETQKLEVKQQEDELDFFNFMKSTAALSALDDDEENSNFVKFRGRIVDKSIAKQNEKVPPNSTKKTPTSATLSTPKPSGHNRVLSTASSSGNSSPVPNTPTTIAVASPTTTPSTTLPSDKNITTPQPAASSSSATVSSSANSTTSSSSTPSIDENNIALEEKKQ